MNATKGPVKENAHGHKFGDKQHEGYAVCNNCGIHENQEGIQYDCGSVTIICPHCTGKIHPETIVYRIRNDEQTFLKKLRAIINGKLSKRVITPEQQAKMQAARQKVV